MHVQIVNFNLRDLSDGDCSDSGRGLMSLLRDSVSSAAL